MCWYDIVAVSYQQLACHKQTKHRDKSLFSSTNIHVIVLPLCYIPTFFNVLCVLRSGMQVLVYCTYYVS